MIYWANFHQNFTK